MSADFIQEDPDYGHDSSDHRYRPDDHGVCLECGWWDRMGDICPGCGETWEKHPSLDELLLELSKILLAEVKALKKKYERSSFMSGTNFSSS